MALKAAVKDNALLVEENEIRSVLCTTTPTPINSRPNNPHLDQTVFNISFLCSSILNRRKRKLLELYHVVSSSDSAIPNPEDHLKGLAHFLAQNDLTK